MSLEVAEANSLEDILTKVGSPLTTEAVVDGIVTWGLSRGRVKDAGEVQRRLLDQPRGRTAFWLAKQIIESKIS